jgi:hypothetical protein
MKLNLTDTVEKLHEIIYEKYGYPADMYKLYLRGQSSFTELQPKIAFAEYGMKN